MTVQWEDWVPRHVVTRHAKFLGFGRDGNGDELLVELDDLGANVSGRDGEIEFRNRDGDDITWAKPGDWIVHGTRGEFYAVTPEVHADKYVPRHRRRFVLRLLDLFGRPA